MSDLKIEILVAQHKAADVISNDIYTPIHVGKARSDLKLDIQGDDTGDNISEKNNKYCELTALYWAWKNLAEVDVIGLAHYRRYFPENINKSYIQKLFGEKGYKVIVCKDVVHSYSVDRELISYIGFENAYILFDSLLMLYPDYKEALCLYMYSNHWIPFNMYISTKDWSDNYCQWLFSILEYVEKRMSDSSYTRANRALGYMGEFLLGVYITHYQNCRCKSVKKTKYYLLERKRTAPSIREHFLYLLYDITFEMLTQYKLKRRIKKLVKFKGRIAVLPTVVTSLKADGIELNDLMKASL